MPTLSSVARRLRAPLEAHAARAGRPFWELTLRDGAVVDERDTDWLDAPRTGRAAIRLVCPDGQVARFASRDPASGLLLQFKCAEVRTPVGAAEPGPETVEAVAPSGARGVWTRPAPPPAPLPGPEPPATGRFTTAYVVGRVVGTDGECECAVWEPYPGRLGFFRDNVYGMAYRRVGALSPDHLGLVAP
jgi:hypothetical protein